MFNSNNLCTNFGNVAAARAQKLPNKNLKNSPTDAGTDAKLLGNVSEPGFEKQREECTPNENDNCNSTTKTAQRKV